MSAMSQPLHLTPPQITPEEYFSPGEAMKMADIRLTMPPNQWVDEVTQALLREHPYIDPNRIIVSWHNIDESNGYAIGRIGIDGAPQVSIPVIIANRILKPLDILIMRTDTDGDTEQGVGNMTEDKVVPLSEDTFNMALDSGDAGEVLNHNDIKGTTWTEDGSALRLPFTGRTVVASVMGASEESKEAFVKAVRGDSEIAAGFSLHNSDVAAAWLDAMPPGNAFNTKMASQLIPLTEAKIASSVPDEVLASDFLAAHIYTDGGETKAALSFDVVDLANPVKLSRVLAFEDGTYCPAPEKVAAVMDENQDQLATSVVGKLAALSLRVGGTVSFQLDENFTAPVKIAKVQIDERNDSIFMKVSDGLHEYPITMSKAIKTATLSPEGGWVIPMTSTVLTLGDYAQDYGRPMAIEKVATHLAGQVPDWVSCNGKQFSFRIAGHDISLSNVDEAKCAEVLGGYLSNSDDLMALVKIGASENGGSYTVRFNSNLSDLLSEIDEKVAEYDELLKVAESALPELRMDMTKAVKLASALSDPEGADAVLSTGFLTEDNLAEFAGLSDQFEEVVSKLARLLLLIRLGSPQGDEQATMVAMKSLHRVAERLHSMTTSSM